MAMYVALTRESDKMRWTVLGFAKSENKDDCFREANNYYLDRDNPDMRDRVLASNVVVKTIKQAERMHLFNPQDL